MWVYEKKLEFPIKIKNKDLNLAKLIITQYGGPDGELGAAIRYLSQRFAMPTEETKAILNDIGVSLSKKRIFKTTQQIHISSHTYHSCHYYYIEF